MLISAVSFRLGPNSKFDYASISNTSSSKQFEANLSTAQKEQAQLPLSMGGVGLLSRSGGIAAAARQTRGRCRRVTGCLEHPPHLSLP